MFSTYNTDTTLKAIEQQLYIHKLWNIKLEYNGSKGKVTIFFPNSVIFISKSNAPIFYNKFKALFIVIYDGISINSKFSIFYIPIIFNYKTTADKLDLIISGGTKSAKVS